MDEAQYGDALRHLRRREMVRIAWRDISGLAPLHATLRETSWFAEAVIASATRFAEACLVQRHGAPAGRRMPAWWCWAWASWVAAS